MLQKNLFELNKFQMVTSNNTKQLTYKKAILIENMLLTLDMEKGIRFNLTND